MSDGEYVHELCLPCILLSHTSLLLSFLVEILKLKIGHVLENHGHPFIFFGTNHGHPYFQYHVYDNLFWLFTIVYKFSTTYNIRTISFIQQTYVALLSYY